MNLTIIFTTKRVDIRGYNMMVIQTFYMMDTFTIYMRDISMSMSYPSRIKTRSPALPVTPVAAMMINIYMATTAGTKPFPTVTTPTT